MTSKRPEPPPPPKQEPSPPPDRSLDGLTGGACRNCIGTAVALYDLRREHARLKNVLQGDHGLTPKELARAWVAADRDAKLKRIKKECTWLKMVASVRNETIVHLKSIIHRHGLDDKGALRQPMQCQHEQPSFWWPLSLTFLLGVAAGVCLTIQSMM